jgi:hypothetical protein
MLGKLDIHMEKTTAETLSPTLYKTHSKWSRDPNIRPVTLKLLQENSGRYRRRTPIAQEIRTRIDKWNCSK